jgi:putative acetyltransferase
MMPPAAGLTVRRAVTADAAAYARIMGDPDVLANLMQLPFTSEEIWRQRLAENIAPGKTDLILVAERDGIVVGSAGLHPQAPLRRRHAAMLGISVAPGAQGQGVGTALMAAMCDWADGWAQILRIELTVFADNERAIRLYERFGFAVEGRLRGFAMRAGRYEDALCMARLHPEPPAIR